ncbi:unnamed protein product [Owenia fusiformis]|uniref:Uncharacterized protein n=1 Tax=Owenia fusiformis TaxID=6347 RepID=A0A8S4N2K4_OWEFU|nr:unnamed protein product [Owenia fusiformis]
MMKNNKYGLMSHEVPPVTSDNGTSDKSLEIGDGESNAEARNKAWLDKKALILAVLLIICGTLVIILGIVVDSMRTYTFFKAIPDFILASLMIVTGIIGIFAAKRKTKPFIITLMVLTIITIVISCLLIMHHGTGIKIESRTAIRISQVSLPNYNCTHHYEWKDDVYCYIHPRSNETFTWKRVAKDQAYQTKLTALHCTLMLLSLAAAVICIVASGLTCKATCCAPTPPVKIVYIPVDSSVTITSLPNQT